MTPGQINDLINRLLQTGQFLGTKTFELALKQVHINATTSLVWGIILLIPVIVGIYLIFRGVNENEEGESLFGSILTVVFGLFSGINLNYAFLYHMNPEWYAVKLLLSTFIK